MVEGTTKTGFKFSVDPEIMKDMEVIELLSDMMQDGTKTPKFLTLLLGAEQRKALYDHVRNGKGRVMYDKVEAEVSDIFDAIREAPATKN